MRRSSWVEGLARLFVAVGVVIASTGLGSVPAGPAPAAWSAPLVVNPAQGGDPDPGGGSSGDSSGDSSSGDSSGDAVASKPKDSGSSDSGGGDRAPDVDKAPNSAPDSNSDSGSSGEQAEVVPPPPGAATQDGPTSSGTDTPRTAADPGALTEPDSGASGQTQNLSPVVNRDPQSDLLADNQNPATRDLVNKYKTPSPTDPNAVATAQPGQDGTPPPVGVAPGPVRPGDPVTAADGALVQPGTAVTKPPVDQAATWKCATMGMGCDSSGVDLSTIDLEPAHQTLDTASFVPGANIPAAAVNTTMYLGEGKYGDALIAAAAIAPGGKWVTAGGKLAAQGLSKGYEWFKGTGAYRKIGDALGFSKALPSGVKEGWQSRPARGDGTIWQKPGSAGNRLFRI